MYWNFHTHTPSPLALVSYDLLQEKPLFTPHGFTSAGLHPWSLPLNPQDTTAQKALDKLSQYAQEGRLKAIGECGFDPNSMASMSVQRYYLQQQYHIALQHQFPLVLHVVKSWQELHAWRTANSITLPLIIHGFRGKAPLAQQLLQQGYWLSFGVYHHSESLNLAWQHKRMLLETDAQNEVSIGSLYQEVATQLHISTEQLALEMAACAQHLWGQSNFSK